MSIVRRIVLGPPADLTGYALARAVTAPEPLWPGAPRQRPSRPFPPRAFVPGTGARPQRDAAPAPPHVPAERWDEDDEYLFGVDLYHAGFFWEAHEAWEGIWKASPDPTQREFLQGLIQLAASALKGGRGGRTLEARSRARLARVAAAHAVYMGLDVRALLSAVWQPPPRLVLAARGP
jgi:hypothetical protein